MGNKPEAPQAAPKPDLSTALFQLKMAAKRFHREANKAEKEKAKNMKQVEVCLKKGDEESARLFATNAQNNINDYKKYLRMGSRLEFVAGQLKNNNAMNEIMGGISKNVNPILQQGADSMDIKELCTNFNTFQENFDKLNVNANIMGDNFDKMSSEGNTVENAEGIFNQMKNKVMYGGDTNPDSLQTVPQQQMAAQKKEEDGLNDYIKNLKDL